MYSETILLCDIDHCFPHCPPDRLLTNCERAVAQQPTLHQRPKRMTATRRSKRQQSRQPTTQDALEPAAAIDAVASDELEADAEASGPASAAADENVDNDPRGPDEDGTGTDDGEEAATEVAAAIAAESTAFYTGTDAQAAVAAGQFQPAPGAHFPPARLAMQPAARAIVPTGGSRRAVRIAPMGVAGAAPAVVPDVPRAAADVLQEEPPETVAVAAAAAMAASESFQPVPPQGDSVEASAGAEASEAAAAVLMNTELTKTKRRGTGGVVPISEDLMTPEERTKQKRMLRNRESAARSRDRRKTRDSALEKDIAKHTSRSVTLKALHCELLESVIAMRAVLEHHKVPLPQE